MQVEKINIFNSDMNPEGGGIQNTAYYLVLSLSKKTKVSGYTGVLPNSYRCDDIEVTSSYTVLNVVKWLFHKSKERNTVNIAMNCWEALPAMIIYKLTGTKYIVLAHGNDVYSLGETHGIKQKIFDTINRSIFNNACLIACNSEYTRGLLKYEAYVKKSTVIHPPCSKFAVDSKEDTLYRHRVLSIGRLVERKGFQFVIESIPELLEEYPDLEYVVIGDGPYKSNLMNLVGSLSLEGHVKFLGRVSDTEKIEQYKRCSVFVMPSIEISDDDTVEGFGIVYIEANQLGKYVISGRCGGVPEAVIEGSTGTILEHVDKTSVKESISKVFENIESLYTDDMVSKRKKWAELHFIDNISEEYISAIRKIED